MPSLTSKGIIRTACNPSAGWLECRRKCVPEVFGWALQWVQINPLTESLPLTPLTLELFPWKPPCLFPTLRFSFLLVRNLECLFYLVFLSFAVLEVLLSKLPKYLKELEAAQSCAGIVLVFLAAVICCSRSVLFIPVPAGSCLALLPLFPQVPQNTQVLCELLQSSLLSWKGNPNSGLH